MKNSIHLKIFKKQKFDGSSRFIIASSERMKTTDFAIFMWAESLAMVVPLPGEEHRIFAFVHPFQSTVIIHFVARSVCQRYELFFIYVTHRYGCSSLLPVS